MGWPSEQGAAAVQAVPEGGTLEVGAEAYQVAASPWDDTTSSETASARTVRGINE